MERRLSLKRFITTILLGLTIVFSGLFVACGLLQTDTYSLQSDKIGNVLVYQSDFDFDQYFSNTYIKKITEGGEEFLIPVTLDMLVGEIDTSSVGTKSVKFEYNSKQLDFEYVVKYKVEFLVDGEVFDTQLVLNKNELDLTKTPTKEGSSFINWEEITEELDGNKQINAKFSEDVVIPQLQTLSAMYEDMLGSLTLPSNKFGSWQFENDPNQLVGDIGTRTENVKFVLTNGDVIANDTVNIEISKRNLEFSFDSLEFVYDGAEKEPSYQLVGTNNQNVDILYVPYYNGSATNVGEYDFEFIIEDPNYEGEYIGKFEIVKKHVKVVIDSAQMLYNDVVPTISFVAFDQNENALEQGLLEKLNIVLNTPIFSPEVGEYDIDLVDKEHDNFDIEVVKGKLTVNKATYNVDAMVENAVYGDSLSQVELISTIQNIGQWQWEDDEIVILTPTTFSANAIFTPSDTKNYNSIQKEITFSVQKRMVEIRVLENEFTYDAESKALTCSVEGVLDGDYTISGNTPQTDAGTYDLFLSIVSDKYQSQSLATQLIINKARIANFVAEQEKVTEITYNPETASKLKDVKLSKDYAWKNINEELVIGEKAYEVLFVPSDTNNYEQEEGVITFKVNKAQGEISVVMPENGKYTYSVNDYGFKATVNNKEQEIVYSYLYNGESVKGLRDAGNYVITITCAESTHYVAIQETVEVEILAIENTDEVVSIINATYLDKLEKFVNNLPENDYGVWSWQEGLTSLVGDAGEQVHIAIFTPHDAVNYQERSVEVVFNVAKKTVEQPTLSTTQIVYNGAIQKPSVQTNDLYTITNDGGLNVGDYHVVLTLKDKANYKWANGDVQDLTLNYEITKATNVFEEEPAISEQKWTYGEENATITFGKASFGDVTVKYTDGTTEYAEMPTKPGSYKVVFTVEGTDNYTGLVKEIEFVINKILVQVPQNQWVTYTGSTLTANISNTELYEVIENDGGIEAGEYDVKVRLINTTNYRWTTTENEVVVIKFYIQASDDNIWLIEPNISDWVYGEKANAPQYQSKFGDVIVKYVGTDGTIYESSKMPTNVGTYKVTFTVEDTESFTGLVKEIEFVISHKVISIPETTETTTYDGTEKIFATETENYTVTNGVGIDAGKYNVILTLIDKVNYKWTNGNSEDIALECEILKIDNAFTVEPTISKLAWTYGQEGATVSVGSASFGEVIVKYTDGTTEYTEMPTNAGSYKAVFIVEASTNYNTLTEEIEFTIDQALVDLPGKPANKEYTGEHLTADVVESDLYTITNAGGIDAGDYDVIYTLDGNKYKWADGKEGYSRTYKFTITPAMENAWVTLPELDKEEWTCGEQITYDLGEAKYGTAEVEYYDANGNQTIPTDVGSYTAVFVVYESVSYPGLTKRHTFKIVPYQLILTAPQYVTTPFYENTVNLADSVNMISEPSVDREATGEYTYSIAKDQAIVNGTVKVTVNFIPDDTNNFIAPSAVTADIYVKTIATIGSNAYGSIESALLVATSGNEIWVTAGEKQAVIAEDCVIPSGVVLNVPHTATTNAPNGMNTNGTAVISGSNSAPTITVETIVTINAGVTLTNRGTLKVAGELSGASGGSAYAGHTAGKAAKIVMKTNAKILNINGTINLFGIIVEESDGNGSDGNGSEVIVEGGNLYMPYVVRDFRGGSYMYKIYTKATAFNEFELRNITSTVTVKKGANVYGYANLYAGDQQNATTVTLVSTSSNAIIHFNDNEGYLTAKYNIVGGYKGVDTWADGVLDLKIYGDATVDPMSLKIKVSFISATVSTADVFFPLTWRLKVSLYDGDYKMGYQYKLMPGHVLTVGEGAKLTIGTLIVYTQDAFDGFTQPSNVPNTHYINKTNIRDAQCIIENGGSLIVSTAVGGNIIKEEGGTFEHTVSIQSYWTCDSCGKRHESKPSWVCGLTSCWTSSFTHHEIKSTTVTSKEGIDSNGGTYDITLDLSINGALV